MSNNNKLPFTKSNSDGTRHFYKVTFPTLKNIKHFKRNVLEGERILTRLVWNVSSECRVSSFALHKSKPERSPGWLRKSVRRYKRVLRFPERIPH